MPPKPKLGPDSSLTAILLFLLLSGVFCLSPPLRFSNVDIAAPTHAPPITTRLVSPFHSTNAHLLSYGAYNNCMPIFFK